MAKEKEEKTFEENIANLETIVRDLESGSVPLDDAINKFNEAMKLAKECNDKLKSAEDNINKILKENGKLEDFSIEEE
jgi:exodeoxyribonuclease VII small subunit